MHNMGRNGVGNPSFHTDLPFLFPVAGGGSWGNIVNENARDGGSFHPPVLRYAPLSSSQNEPQSMESFFPVLWRRMLRLLPEPHSQ